MIQGTRVALRAFQPDDLPTLRRWHADGAVMRYWSVPQPVVPAHAFADEVAPGGRFTRFEANGSFCVCDETGRPIGRIDYEGDAVPARHAELALYIGEPDAWSRGYGTEAIVLLLGWLFNQRGLHRVWLSVLADNPRARRTYEKIGFTHEGRWREHYFYDGAWHDADLFGILAAEFNARHPATAPATTTDRSSA
jgi:RimJ/RimL family protein N-acetyltransferase